MGKQAFKCTGRVREDHRQPIYCVAFNTTSSTYKDMAASVGSNRATVYRVPEGGGLDVVQAYVDEDEQEEWFVCKWTSDTATGAPLLLVAGLKGILRVLDCHAHILGHTFAGHGGSINDIAVMPGQPAIIATGSRDESIRLWNFASRTCVLVLAGEGGHRNEVLSIDFHPWDATRLVSASMDSSVKIWSLAAHQQVIQGSYTWDQAQRSAQPGHVRSFPVRIIQFPIFSSVQIHANYVDCVRWLGDLVLSKSVDGAITLWRPTPPDQAQDLASQTADWTLEEEEVEGSAPRRRLRAPLTTSAAFTKLQDYELPNSHIWWVKFGLDPHLTTLACGNKGGELFVWDPHQSPPKLLAQLHPAHGGTVVRQTAVNWGGTTILAAGEGGIIWRWDRRSTSSPGKPSTGVLGKRASGAQPAEVHVRAKAKAPAAGVAGSKARGIHRAGSGLSTGSSLPSSGVSWDKLDWESSGGGSGEGVEGGEGTSGQQASSDSPSSKHTESSSSSSDTDEGPDGMEGPSKRHGQSTTPVGNRGQLRKLRRNSEGQFVQGAQQPEHQEGKQESVGRVGSASGASVEIGSRGTAVTITDGTQKDGPPRGVEARTSGAGDGASGARAEKTTGDQPPVGKHSGGAGGAAVPGPNATNDNSRHPTTGSSQQERVKPDSNPAGGAIPAPPANAGAGATAPGIIEGVGTGPSPGKKAQAPGIVAGTVAGAGLVPSGDRDREAAPGGGSVAAMEIDPQEAAPKAQGGQAQASHVVNAGPVTRSVPQMEQPAAAGPPHVGTAAGAVQQKQKQSSGWKQQQTRQRLEAPTPQQQRQDQPKHTQQQAGQVVQPSTQQGQPKPSQPPAPAARPSDAKQTQAPAPSRQPQLQGARIKNHAISLQPPPSQLPAPRLPPPLQPPPLQQPPLQPQPQAQGGQQLHPGQQAGASRQVPPADIIEIQDSDQEGSPDRDSSSSMLEGIELQPPQLGRQAGAGGAGATAGKQAGASKPGPAPQKGPGAGGGTAAAPGQRPRQAGSPARAGASGAGNRPSTAPQVPRLQPGQTQAPHPRPAPFVPQQGGHKMSQPGGSHSNMVMQHPGGSRGPGAVSIRPSGAGPNPAPAGAAPQKRTAGVSVMGGAPQPGSQQGAQRGVTAQLGQQPKAGNAGPGATAAGSSRAAGGVGGAGAGAGGSSNPQGAGGGRGTSTAGPAAGAKGAAAAEREVVDLVSGDDD